jgi:hypothetical protein
VQNYQETVNTLLFGQKAKNIKTTVNINEISIKIVESQVKTNEIIKVNESTILKKNKN